MMKGAVYSTSLSAGHRKPPNFAALMGGSIFIGQNPSSGGWWYRGL